MLHVEMCDTQTSWATPLLQLGTPFSRQEDKKRVSPSTQGRKAFPGSSKMDNSGKATNENIAYPLLLLALPLVVRAKIA
jgi:hypothetical protein